MSFSTRLALICLAGSWLLAVTAAAPAEEPMRVDLVQDLHWQDHHFVMTNWFYRYKGNDPAAQVQILAERGYDGVVLSLKDEPGRWRMLPAYLEALEEHGMTLTGIHTRFYVEDESYPDVVKKNLPLLEGTKALLIPSVGSRTNLSRTDPEVVERAAKILREKSDDARRFGLGGVAMYTHIDNWVETVDDAIRAAKAADRRNVGTIFHLHHFQATNSTDLAGTLRRAKPYLMCVIIQGTDEDRATHKILGEGSFDMTPLVSTLRAMDYQGPLGTMGFTQSGDIPGKLERARKAWDAIKQEALERER